MANLLYNGVSLPPLPQRNEEIHPCAYIMGAATINRLLLTSVPLSYYDSGLTSNGAVVSLIEYHYDADTNTWVLYKEATQAISYGYRTWWSNTDIYDSTGTLYLAATDPLPVGKPITDPLTYMAGYNWMKAMLAKRAGRKPVAYLYNGVRLPEIPEVEGYDYCYLRMFMGSVPQLYISTEPAYYEDGVHFSGNVQMAICSDGVWNDFSATEITSVADCVWCNTDILNADGAMYLAASEPVPVYE